MSIKIKKDGQVREFILPATNIQVLDMADKFKKKDLENVIKEISDTEHIYIGEVDETKDGIWIDDGEILDNEENNGVVERIKEYVDGEIKNHSQPNLLINGDFQVWSNGESFTQNGVFTADKWKTYRSNQTISKCAENTLRILKTSSSGATGITQEFENYTMFNGKEATFSFKAKASVDNHTIFVRVGETVESMDLNTSNQKYSFTIDSLDFTTAQHSINIGSSKANVGEYIELQEIKLELGCKATPFVPKKYYEELLACNDGMIGGQPNLLINGDFQIWQRGTSFTTTNSYLYTADRWCVNNGIVSKATTNNQYAIKITSQSNDKEINLQQYVEHIHKFKGKTLTLSWESTVSKDVDISYLIFSYTGTGSVSFSSGAKTYKASNGVEKHSVTFTIPSNLDSSCNNLTIRILRRTNLTSSVDITITNVKLEIGAVATPFSSKLYSQELADCQRYCQAQQLLGLPFRFGTNFISASISTPVTMRTAPTLIGDIDNWTIYNNNAVVQTGFTSTAVTSKCNGAVNIQFNKTNHGLKVTDGIYFTTSNVILDAEIY